MSLRVSIVAYLAHTCVELTSSLVLGLASDVFLPDTGEGLGEEDATPGAWAGAAAPPPGAAVVEEGSTEEEEVIFFRGNLRLAVLLMLDKGLNIESTCGDAEYMYVSQIELLYIQVLYNDSETLPQKQQ